MSDQKIMPDAWLITRKKCIPVSRRSIGSRDLLRGKEYQMKNGKSKKIIASSFTIEDPLQVFDIIVDVIREDSMMLHILADNMMKMVEKGEEDE